MDQVLAVEGPMARRIADLRAGLEVLAGPDPRDPWSVPVDLVATAGPKRIAVVAEPPGGATNPLIADVVRTAANALADAGHQVEEIDVPSYEDAIRCWETLVIGSLINHHDQLAPVLGDNGRTFLEGAMTWYRQNPSRPDLETAWMDRRALAVSFNHFFTEWDAVLTPTWTQLPFPVGFDLTADGPAAVLELIRPVMVANVLGLPSVAVPAGQIDGLPVGVLINGPAWSEMDCLALAEVVEGLAPATPITPQANPPQGS